MTETSGKEAKRIKAKRQSIVNIVMMVKTMSNKAQAIWMMPQERVSPIAEVSFCILAMSQPEDVLSK